MCYLIFGILHASSFSFHFHKLSAFIAQQLLAAAQRQTCLRLLVQACQSQTAHLRIFNTFQVLADVY